MRAPDLQNAKRRAGRITAPRPSEPSFHGLQKPEIAYLPTACAETLPFLAPTVLSCCLPDMGWQSWKFEGQARQSPHILVYDTIPRELLGHVVLSRSACLAGVDPAIQVLVARSPGLASLARGWN